MSEHRYIRQSGMFSQSMLNNHPVTIIGVGAIGRNVALQLTAMGVQNLHLYDFDTVEEHNVATQGYRNDDVGSMKTVMTQDACKDINPDTYINIYSRRFKTTDEISDHVIFMCVDSIRTRKFIFEAVKPNAFAVIDTRMAAESFRILTANDSASRSYYETTLFSQGEAFQQSCTSKSTIYCASIAAGFAISSFTKMIRNVPTDKDVFVNLFANEMSFGG